MNVTIRVPNPETGEEVLMVARRTPSGNFSLQLAPTTEPTPRQIVQRLRFSEAAIRARGRPPVDRTPVAAEMVAALARGPVFPGVPLRDPEAELQEQYRSWLGPHLAEVVDLVMGSPRVRSSREIRVAARVAERKGRPIPEAQELRPGAPRPPAVDLGLRPRPR